MIRFKLVLEIWVKFDGITAGQGRLHTKLVYLQLDRSKQSGAGGGGVDLTGDPPGGKHFARPQPPTVPAFW